MWRLSGLTSACSGVASKKLRRVTDDELIERRAARDEHRRRSAASPARATRALPGRRNRAGIPGHDADVERADVDTELKRVGRYHRAHGSLAQPFLDLTAALRQVTAAIPANLILRARLPAEIVLQIRRQDFGREPALREHDQLQLPLEEFRRNPSRFRDIRPSNAELLIDHRRIDEQEELLAARRAAFGDELERLFDERLRELLRIGNGRRRADERGIRSVVLADAPHPPQDVGQVAAKYAAIRVQLVDHDIPEVLEELRPPRMVREDARMDHVRVAEDHVRASANGAPGILRRIAVVREDADLEL